MKRLTMLDPLEEIRHLYFNTTRATIDRDFERALDLIKSMGSEEERSRATVFMHGLAEMRKQWGQGGRGTSKKPRRAEKHPEKKSGK